MVKYHILSMTKDLGFATSIINPVVFESDNGLVLFDAGYPNQIDELINELKKIGHKISDIDKVVISHHDHDHIGSLQEITKANPKIRTASSLIESKFITGESKSLRLIQAQEYNKTLKGNDRIFGEQFVNYLETINTNPVNEIIHENDYVCKGVKVIETPGHTPGHISLLLEEERVLFAGDALAIDNGRLGIANPQFTLDKTQALRSIDKIRNLHLNSIICYHGNIFIGSIEEELNTLLNNEDFA